MKPKGLLVTLLFIGGIIVGALLLGGTQYILSKTSTTEFCISCHSMDAPYQEYQGSVHFRNISGVRAECRDCHLPPEPLDYLLAKVRASKDVYHEFVTGKIDTPEKYESHRTSMAETVWAQLKANDSATCRSCHDKDSMELYDQKPEAQKMHQYGFDNGQTCIDCHKGVAHIAPVMEMDDKALDGLKAEAAKTTTDAKQVYPLQSIALNGDAGELGTITPSTELAVLSAEGGKRTVKLSGYQLKGAEQVVYLGRGQRAVLATLTEAGVAALQGSTFSTDEYGNEWQPVTLQGTIDAAVLADRAPLWAYAEQLDNVYCSTCHAKIPGHHFTVNAWAPVAKSMGERTSISAEDLEILTKYFQYQAKDVAHK